jgi:Mn-dependent DtxR family transcriptional regulator
MSARPPREVTDNIESLVRGLPDDVVRLRLIQSLADLGGRARVADLAKKISVDSSGEAARAIIAAAKDGLVQFTDENSSVRITELGTKLADRQSKSAY